VTDTRTDPRCGVAILGLGASGVAAARLALSQGEKVYASDTRTDAPVAARGAELRALGARVGLGGHDLEGIASAHTVVVSPGIPPDAPVLRGLRERGVRWISEPEFAFRFFKGPLIAVTGTNGKTTTAALAAHLLETGGTSVGLGGNIGAGLGPAASELALLAPAPEWLVVEVSSFQLADIDTFRPDIGVVTNLAPDHLDRYEGVDEYYGDKARIFENADARCRWVLNGDDPAVLQLAADAPGERFLFGGEGERGSAAFVRDGILTLDVGEGDESLAPWHEVPLLGRHNRTNALAAALTARLAGTEPAALAEGLRTARPLPHRLEPVAELGGVLWVDDSKATNVAATVSAVMSLEERPLVVLLGGKDKGEDLSPLGPALSGRCRTVLCYGAAGPRFAEALRAVDLSVELLGSSFEAVMERAAEVAQAGDAVLLSPACSSFDMFESYEARGLRFRALLEERTG
jgi:UDP-N-acetylmuramoylalanine--D-glutamate ligase